MQIPELNHQVQGLADSLSNEFERAKPFKHLTLQNFFEESFLLELTAEFPAFDRTDCLNENGEPGLKGVYSNIADLGGSYRRLDLLIQSPDFLRWLSACTGINDLLYDPFYFGGGTHENRSGQDLDLHIDFNLHPLTNWHRRLNLIVYLNEEWDKEWGGNLVLRANPRDPNSSAASVIPQLNCCVIFETTESSWHGFERIQTPVESLGRKSIALYFYTRERPQEQLADPHSTIYIESPLPDYIVPGYVLKQEDVHSLGSLLKRRDDHLDRIYRENQRLQALLDVWRNRFFGSRLINIMRWCRYKYMLWKLK
ncbi:MAG: 2OG-Fe(II) oxygenase [Congregibacter sp.]